MGGLSCLWEFKLESWTMQVLGLSYEEEFEEAERWRFVLTSTGFSMLSLILPSVLLRRLVRNTGISYRRMQSEQSQTETLAKYDSLTGLINRRVFMDLLRDRIKRGDPTVVFLIDLDHFKPINDKYGHSVGDSVICEVAIRLEDIALSYEGIAARLGGDEFCIVLLGDPGEVALRQRAENIIANLSAPMPHIIEESALGATVGIARSMIDARNASALLHCADIAMYHGKRGGRSTYNFYDAEYERERLAHDTRNQALRQAVDREEIIPYFQPIVSLPSQKVVGFEILARWLKPCGEMGMPADFIPVLEGLGLIPEMTISLVRQACSAARHLDDDIRLSLNVSAAMIIDEGFPDRLIEQLRLENFACTRFEVEITEEALVGNMGAAKRNLSRLRKSGITVALDDFGIGYSGLYHLTRLAIDKIKIDRSFFEPGDEDHLTMVEAILGMARTLKMQVTAEGIEEFHLPDLPSWLSENGCHYAQGYLYGRPQPVASLS